ncbi:uncharacterized protein M421DRAFT_71828 [Didymella exigua CBS 183.55]|uniref:Major facilitator superfamily (MFS) profile domain-containing protein n=1 Tax=Didymella exigua CBS 183.55 TaxID=1150837 RepID=A0A6A5RBM2_9PLEO|nr:uncharacterized protein M421DRAFT_71828 [Didymella exigua CBS 183.55]KAF1924749.1 hypothetical protein M421DRAFT_71828 [Didymella exigua CBS 183.55]
MTLFVLVSLTICFSVGPILGSTLTYLDIENISEYDYHWERIAGVVVGISRPITTDLYLSWLGYMGSTSGGDLNYTRHCFCGCISGLHLY